MPNLQAKTVFVPASDGERFSIIGGGVRILIDGAASAGRCCVFEAPIPPGDGPPLHKHEREDELFYVLDGTFKFEIDGRECIRERGSFACAPRGSVHAFKNIGSTIGHLLVTCTPAGIEVPFRSIRIPEPGSTIDGRPGMPPTMEQVIAELGKHGITFSARRWHNGCASRETVRHTPSCYLLSPPDALHSHAMV